MRGRERWWTWDKEDYAVAEASQRDQIMRLRAHPSMLVWLNWLQYSSGILIPNTAPYWIVLMWGLFATILNVSLRWLRGRWLIAAIAGGLGGPLAYYGGHRLGALEFGDQNAALIALALGWAVVTPILVALSERFDGYAPVLTGRAT